MVSLTKRFLQDLLLSLFKPSYLQSMKSFAKKKKREKTWKKALIFHIVHISYSKYFHKSFNFLAS